MQDMNMLKMTNMESIGMTERTHYVVQNSCRIQIHKSYRSMTIIMSNLSLKNMVSYIMMYFYNIFFIQNYPNIAENVTIA